MRRVMSTGVGKGIDFHEQGVGMGAKSVYIM
jgi:hypothetical protein